MAEILTIADETSLAYTSFQSDYPAKPHSDRLNEALLQHQIPFIKAGAPYDAVLLSDLGKVNFDRYKLIYFLNTYNVDDASRRLIEEKVKGNNRVVVWCYAPGYFNGTRESAALIQELTGLKVEPTAAEAFVEPRITLTPAGREWMEKLGEKPLTNAFGMDGKICRLFSVKDPGVESLGTLQGAADITFARRSMGHWTSFYTMTPVLTPELVRALARFTGVHVYNPANDTFYGSKSYLSINGGIAGDKSIRLPFAADVYNAVTEELLLRRGSIRLRPP